MSKLSPSPGMVSPPIAASVRSMVPETTNSSPSRTTLRDSSWPVPNVSSGSPLKVVVVPMYSPSSYGSDWTSAPSLKSKVSPDSCSARAAGSWPAICATSEEMAKIMVPSTVLSDCRSSCMSILTQPVSPTAMNAVSAAAPRSRRVRITGPSHSWRAAGYPGRSTFVRCGWRNRLERNTLNFGVVAIVDTVGARRMEPKFTTKSQEALAAALQGAASASWDLVVNFGSMRRAPPVSTMATTPKLSVFRSSLLRQPHRTNVLRPGYPAARQLWEGPVMRTRRLLGAAALATFVAVGLTGCIKMDMQLDLKSDDTVDGSMIFAISSEVAQLMGEDAESIADSMQQDMIDVGDGGETRSEPYDDGEYIGTTTFFEGQSLETFSSGEDTESLQILREGDEFVVSGVMDLSEGAEDSESMMPGIGDSMDIKIAITFPG